MAVTAQRFVRRNRKGRVLTVAREHYLRGASCDPVASPSRTAHTLMLGAPRLC
jgi:hypothetical protein